jgi:hypothetical protein
MIGRIVVRSKYVWATLVLGCLSAAAALAQPPAPPAPPAPPDADRLFFLQNAAPVPALGASIDIIRSEGGVPGPVVKGKPYSARSITESTQVLADGNRITQRNEAVFHRDGEGRTRREQTLTGVGQWQVGEPTTMINIHDPVAGKSYVLDPTAQTAREIRPFQMAIAHTQDMIRGAATEARAVYGAAAVGVPAPAPTIALGGDHRVTVIRGNADEQQVQVFTAPAGVAAFPPETTGMYEPAEDLGEQVLEGLLVQGTRMTDTIPAGSIGNERPIEIVTERWYSKDIDAMVLQRFSDPRFGETVYRLVNVVRSEPSPELFQVPQGYEFQAAEMPRAGVRVLPGPVGETVQFELRRLE